MTRPKLSLRDLIWLILMTCLSLAWWLDHSKLTNRCGMYERQISNLQKSLSVNPGFGGFQEPAFQGTTDHFIQVLTTGTESDSLQAASSLGRAELPLIQESVLRVIQLLQDHPDEEVRKRAVITLRFCQQLAPDKMKNQAQVVVPALLPLLDDPSLLVSGEAIFALRAFGPAANLSIEKLTTIMADDEHYWAGWAAMALHDIDPSIDIGSRLLELIGRKHQDWKTIASYAHQYVPADKLRSFLEQMYAQAETEEERMTIVTALNKIKS